MNKKKLLIVLMLIMIVSVVVLQAQTTINVTVYGNVSTSLNMGPGGPRPNELVELTLRNKSNGNIIALLASTYSFSNGDYGLSHLSSVSYNQSEVYLSIDCGPKSYTVPFTGVHQRNFVFYIHDQSKY